jgi:hypothetical protein
MWTHLLFLMFVTLAVYAQALTGFALALILLGLIGATDLVPLTDAVNAVTVMALVIACTFLYRRWPLQLERSLWPAVASSIPGAIAGTILLFWLAGVAHEVLRLLLGLSIVFCALLLWRAAEPHKTVSSRGARIRESLILFFGMGALLRLAIVVPAGHFSAQAIQLAAESIPVVFFVTSVAAGRPSPLPPKLLKAVACLLLVATGTGMIGAALLAMSHAYATY